MRRALIGVLLLTAVTASACSSSGAPARPAKGPAGGNRLVSASFADKGHTMTVHVGDVVRVRLDSTYWKFGTPTTAGVLRAGSPVVHGTTGGRRPPGMGTGTVVESFTAVKAGRTVVRASRTICGEALRCGPATGAFTLTVVVS